MREDEEVVTSAPDELAIPTVTVPVGIVSSSTVYVLVPPSVIVSDERETVMPCTLLSVTVTTTSSAVTEP